jgi:hypothetical protein
MIRVFGVDASTSAQRSVPNELSVRDDQSERWSWASWDCAWRASARKPARECTNNSHFPPVNADFVRFPDPDQVSKHCPPVSKLA